MTTSDVPQGGAGSSGGTGAAGGGSGVGGRAGAAGAAGTPRGGTGGGSAGSSGTGGGTSTCVPGVPATSQLPRLTNAQYYRTVQDLLGAPPTDLLATEQAGDLSKAEWDGYPFAADAIATSVMVDPALRAKYIACTPTGDGAVCLGETIRAFGHRAYRRPLTEEEIARYEKLVARRSEITQSGSFDEVAKVLLGAFLQSPHFLQRPEAAQNAAPTGGYTLTSHEVASRLSYLLWGRMPDAVLASAADADQLRTPEQVLAQAERMVADERARAVMAQFHREYLQMRTASRWDSARKDPMAFPGFTMVVASDMVRETEMLFDRVFTSGGTFRDLLTTNKAFVTKSTAPFYGLNPESFGDDPTETDLDGSRPGFLTRIGFLAAYANPDRTSPIMRGAFINKDVLGIDPGPPDPAATTAKLPDGPGLDTIRKKTEALTGGPPCAGCHVPFLNPPGFVLEAFDATGAPQTTERTTGAALDVRADVRFTADGEAVPITTAAELVVRIADAPGAQLHYSSKLVGFGYSRPLTAADVCTADALAARIQRGDSLRKLLTDLTQTNYFSTRSVEVTP
jgi:hypothetical protein